MNLLKKYQDKCTAGTNLELVVEYLMKEMYQFLDSHLNVIVLREGRLRGSIRQGKGIINFVNFYELDSAAALESLNKLKLPSPTKASEQLLKVQERLREVANSSPRIEALMEEATKVKPVGRQNTDISNGSSHSMSPQKDKLSSTTDVRKEPIDINSQTIPIEKPSTKAAHSKIKACSLIRVRDINKPYKDKNYKLISACAAAGSGVIILLGILMQSKAIETGQQSSVKLGPVLLSRAICWFVAASLGTLATAYCVKSYLEKAKVEEAEPSRADFSQGI